MFQRLSWPGFSISTSSVPGIRFCSGHRPFTLRALSSSSITFVVRPPGGPPPLGTVANFRVTLPNAYDSALTSITVGWDPLANAGGYKIYGKDTATASAYLLLTTLASGLSTSGTWLCS